jgi:putative peptidoglycan lipid II flippase
MLESASDNPGQLADVSLVNHRRILASAAMLGSGTVLAKLIAFAKDLLVASAFGTGDELDAFLVAFLIPSFGVTVLASSFAPAFLPTYIRLLQKQGSAAAERLVGQAMVATCGLLVLLTLLLAFAGPYVLPWIASGFDQPKLDLAASLLRLVVGVLVACGLSAFFSTLLNAHEHFALSATAPLAVPATTLAVFWWGRDRWGIYALAVGTLIGFILECAALGYGAYRYRLLPKPRWPTLDVDLRHVASRYAPVAIGSVLVSSSVVVDQAMAASLGRGNVSILNFGGKVVSLLLGIVAISLSTVLFPRFAHLIAADQWYELRRTARNYFVLILAGSVPCVAVVALGAEPMIRTLFQRGAFTSESTAAASQVQAWLALQIPFYVLVMVGFRLLSALDSYQTILRISALNLGLNIVGDVVLMHWFGVRGIAMSTSLVYLVGAIVTLVAIKMRLSESRAGSIQA